MATPTPTRLARLDPLSHSGEPPADPQAANTATRLMTSTVEAIVRE